MREIILGVAVVAAVALGVSATQSPNVGRWQITNPTPDRTVNIMLLDSQTGDTWVTCRGDGSQMWCRKPRTESTTIKQGEGPDFDWSKAAEPR